jgi:KDO2-lipid IV(A) lauroyltransferase
MDQDTKVKGIFVDFLGRKAFTPTAPAELAIRTGAPLIPVTLVMNHYRTYRVKVGKPLTVPDELENRQKIEQLTRLCNSYLEREIMDQPTQWIWMHKRWKSAAA